MCVLIMPDNAKLINFKLINSQCILIHSLKDLKNFFKLNAFSREKREEYLEYWNTSNGVALEDFFGGEIPYYIILLIKKDRRVIVHESVHMVHLLMDRKGIPIHRENTEIMAYMTDYLVEAIFQALYKRQ